MGRLAIACHDWRRRFLTSAGGKRVAALPWGLCLACAGNGHQEASDLEGPKTAESGAATLHPALSVPPAALTMTISSGSSRYAMVSGSSACSKRRRRSRLSERKFLALSTAT